MAYEKVLFLLLLCGGAFTMQLQGFYKVCLNHCSPTCSDLKVAEQLQFASKVKMDCKCDPDCEIYGDCCHDHPKTDQTPTFTALSVKGLALQCHTTYLTCSDFENENNIWMVSACPGDSDELEENCTGSPSLPPVSDLATGVVYKNEYCAMCNMVENIIPWRYVYQCRDQPYLGRLPGINRTVTIEDIEAGCKLCSFAAPKFNLSSSGLPSPPPRACQPHISTCLAREELFRAWDQEFYEEIVHQCTDGVFSLVQDPLSNLDSVTTYRNQYCAICNNVHAQCYRDDIPCSNIFTEPTEVVSFSLLLDVFGDGKVVVHSETEIITISVTCSPGEVFNPVSKECRSSVCPEGYAVNGGACYQSMLNTSVVNTSLDCYRFRLNDSDYEDLGNETIRVNGVLYQVVSYESGHPIICLTQNGTKEENITVLYYDYPTGYLYLTYIGCSLSVIGCALIIVTYGLFKTLRTVSGKNLINLAAVILTADLFILISGPISSHSSNSSFCTATAIILHALFLAQFSWMSIMMFEVARNFRKGIQLSPLDSNRFKKRIFFAYLVLGWSIPLSITAISVIVNFSADDLILYGVLEDGTRGSCWINHVESAIIAFIVPVALAVVFNGVCFAFIAVVLCNAWKNRRTLDTSNNASYFRILITVFTVTGLTWIFGFTAILAGTSWAWYPFIILNSAQGFVMALGFLLTIKVRTLYRDMISSSLSSVKEVSLSHSSGQAMKPHKVESETSRKETSSV